MKSAMTSSPLRVAIIGAGQVADKVHASYYCTRDDLELVAVCDSRLSQAQALADKYGSGSVWDDPEKMLHDVQPDIVSICSPNRFHYEHPAQIYNDLNGELNVLFRRDTADDNRHLRSMEAFVNHVQGKPVMIADAEQGFVIQQLVAALYHAAETGTCVEL